MSWHGEYARIRDDSALKPGVELFSYKHSKSSDGQARPPESQRHVKSASESLGKALVTAVCCVLILGLLKIWENKGAFSRKQKYVLNTIITGLSLILALNFFEAFKGLAKVLRWKFLASKGREPRRVELILGLDSFVTVFKLGMASYARPLSAFLCFGWILLGLFAQIAVAIVGLTYEVNGGLSYNDTYLVKGDVQVADLSCYYHRIQKGEPICPDRDSPPKDFEALQAIAHTYGDAFESTACGTYNDISEVHSSKHQYPYYCNRHRNGEELTYSSDPQFAYRFLEYNRNDIQHTHPTLTHRIVTATAGKCIEYNINGKAVPIKDESGFETSWARDYSNDTTNGTISIQMQQSAVSGTTYIYRGLKMPQNEEAERCGPRCMYMWAYRAQDDDQPDEKLFQCPITISNVTNTTDLRHEVPDDVALVAAASIGIQGRRVGPRDNTVWPQQQLFPFGSQWSITYQPIEKVGANMAEYAIRSIAAMAVQNPTLEIPGMVPTLGTYIDVKWQYAIPLLVGVTAAHVICALLTIWVTRGVVVPKSSALSTAKVLRPLLKAEYPESAGGGKCEMRKVGDEGGGWTYDGGNR